jgi:hypothetical protein
MCGRSLERSNESDDGSIRTATRLGKPAAWARFIFQAFLATTILMTSIGLMTYDIVHNGKPTETTTVWLPILTFIVGLYFPAKNAKDKKKTDPNEHAAHLDRDHL